MWVTSKRQFSLNDQVQFDKRMVEEKIPRNVPDDELSAQFVDPGSKAENPLVVCKDEQKAKKTLETFVRKVRREAKKVQTEKDGMIAKGGYDAIRGEKIPVPKVPEFYELEGTDLDSDNG